MASLLAPARHQAHAAPVSAAPTSTPRAPGLANAGCMVGLLPGHTAEHLRDMAEALIARADRMEGLRA